MIDPGWRSMRVGALKTTDRESHASLTGPGPMFI